MSDIGEYVTVKGLVDQGTLERPMDGNHGEIHPKGDDFVATGVPFITAADIKDGRVDVHGCAFISEKQAKSLRKGFAKLGDVLLTHKATIGRTAIVNEIPNGLDWIVLTPQVTYYRVLRKDILDPRYLKVYFDSPAFQTLLESWSGGGSTRAYLGITNQLDLPILVLPIDKQRDIAAVLGALDDKIEQNRRTGRTLEELARATFKAWFVDFEPVKAKAAGQTSFPGMPPASFAALPARLTDSPIGPVPEGWEIGKLGDLLSERGERMTPGDETRQLPYVPIDCITSKRVTLETFKSGEEAQSSLIRFQSGDILFGAMRPYFHKVCLAPFSGTTRTTCFVLVPRSDSDRNYALMLASEDATVQFATTHSVGSTIPYAKWQSSLREMPCVLPPESLRAAYHAIAEQMLQLSNQGVGESAKLAALRDYLLPRLLSGRVRVSNVELPTKEAL